MHISIGLRTRFSPVPFLSSFRSVGALKKEKGLPYLVRRPFGVPTHLANSCLSLARGMHSETNALISTRRTHSGPRVYHMRVSIAGQDESVDPSSKNVTHSSSSSSSLTVASIGMENSPLRCMETARLSLWERLVDFHRVMHRVDREELDSRTRERKETTKNSPSGSGDRVGGEGVQTTASLSSSSYASSARSVARALVGNAVVTLAKFSAFASTGSSAMLAETFHTLIDTVNQGVLMYGLSETKRPPDRSHPFGYGRAPYFYSLLAASTMFFMGCGVTLYHGFESLISSSHSVEVGLSTWLILMISFLADGLVFVTTLQSVLRARPKDTPILKYLRNFNDPIATMILMEDGVATLGVFIAAAGLYLTESTGLVVYDALASISIGSLLGLVSIFLIRMNRQYLLGSSVGPEIEDKILEMLKKRKSVDNVHNIQTQWLSPNEFTFKAEVDFNGSQFSKQLEELYGYRFLSVTPEMLTALLSWYADDVTSLVEKEIREIEKEIRSTFPQARFIEIEPYSRDTILRVHRESEKERRSLLSSLPVGSSLPPSK